MAIPSTSKPRQNSSTLYDFQKHYSMSIYFQVIFPLVIFASSQYPWSNIQGYFLQDPWKMTWKYVSPWNLSLGYFVLDHFVHLIKCTWNVTALQINYLAFGNALLFETFLQVNWLGDLIYWNQSPQLKGIHWKKLVWNFKTLHKNHAKLCLAMCIVANKWQSFRTNRSIE